MPTFNIHHITKYSYDRPVKENISQLRIFPMKHGGQTLVSSQLQITGQPPVAMFTDFFGNTTGDFSLLAPHTELIIDSRIKVKTVDPVTEPSQDTTLQQLQSCIGTDVGLHILAAPESIKEHWMISHILEEAEVAGKSLAGIVWACSEFIYRNFRYEKGITDVETTVDEILHHRSGVCQDFAHVCLQLLRTSGIPARYVSGYICPNRSGLRGEGATHAWVEYYDPKHGWVGIDPTNNVWVGGNHVVLAVGRHFGDCTPVKGTFKGIARQQLSVYVSVGYEDGHVFEDITRVKLIAEPTEEMQSWQADWMASQQQQQQ